VSRASTVKGYGRGYTMVDVRLFVRVTCLHWIVLRLPAKADTEPILP